MLIEHLNHLGGYRNIYSWIVYVYRDLSNLIAFPTEPGTNRYQVKIAVRFSPLQVSELQHLMVEHA